MKVFLMESDYYSNPDLVVIVAQDMDEVHEMYRVLSMIGHEKLIKRAGGSSLDEGLVEIYMGTRDMFVLRPFPWNRKLAKEPKYKILEQSGIVKKENEYLRVFLYIHRHEIKLKDPEHNFAILPEIIVVTAASKEEALIQFQKIVTGNHNQLVRTNMSKNRTDGEWITVDQSIRQQFILRPRGNRDLR